MNFKKISKLSLALLVLVSTFLTGNISVNANELNAKESYVNPVLLNEFKGSNKSELVRNHNDLKETKQTKITVEEPIHSVLAHDEIKSEVNETEISPLTQLLLNEIQARAGPVTNVRTVTTGYTFSWSSSSTISGANSGYAAIDRIYADNELVTCSEPPTPVISGGGYNSSELVSNATRKKLARAAVANNVYAMNDEAYAAWQLYQHSIMYAAEGFTVDSSNVPNLSTYFTQFEAKTTSYWTKPTFNFGDGTIKSGETKTYNVTNGITSGWEIYYTSQGVSATFSNGILTVVNNNTTDDTISIDLSKSVGAYKQLSMVYTKAGSQELVKWGVPDPDYFTNNLTNLRKGDLEITKVDNLGNKVSGVTFDVSYNSDMSNPFATITTGADGSIKEEDIDLGDVYIREKTVVAPLLIDNTIHKVTILPNQTVTYTQTNQRASGTAILYKVDKETGLTVPQGDARLDNAVYALYASTNIYDGITGKLIYTKDQEIRSEVIGTDLKMEVSGLAPGKYYFQETTKSTGHLLDPNKYEVDLTYVNDVTAIIKKEVTSKQQVIKGNFDIRKVIDSGNSGIQIGEPNAKFRVQLEQDVQKVGSAATVRDDLTTNLVGYAKSIDLPYGKYRVTQYAAMNENLELAPYWIVDISENGVTISYVVTNKEHTAYGKGVKVDEGTQINITHSNAEFKIWNVDKQEWYSEVVGSKLVDTWTAENGEVITNKVMPAGNYEWVEVSTPEGYVDEESRFPFEITASNVQETNIDGKAVTVTVMENTRPTGLLTVDKLFERSDERKETKELLVARFQATVVEDTIVPYDGKTIELKAGDVYLNPDSEDGLFTAVEGQPFTVDNIPVGLNGTKLRFEEVETPEGYVPADPFEVEFTHDDQTMKVIQLNKELENKIIRTDIELAKINEYTEELLKGVKGIEITAYLDEELTQVYETQLVDPETGLATFKDVLYGTTLYFAETATHDDYYLSDQVIKVEVNIDLEGIGKVHTFTYANKPKPTIGTTATGLNGEKTLDPTIDNETIDVIAHENIDIDLTYVVETVAISDKVVALIEESTGKEYKSLSDEEKKEALKAAIKENPELVKAREIEKDVKFETKDGEHEVKVTIPANSLEDGEGLVYLEYFFNQETYNPEPTEEEPNIPVVEHEDPTDPGQTIRFEATEYTAEANKVDSVSKNNIKSKEFVFEFTGYKDGKKVESFKVNGDPKTGIATFEFTGAGTYDYIEVREVEAPKGYLLSDEVKTINMEDFDENHMYSFEYVNVLKPAAAVASGDTTQTNLFIGMFILSLGFIVITGRKLRKVKE
ncbi:SpaA isopeptide-forming pilin-related protein [Breznakia pachnodae]|uniref:Uncharacterized protein n=1 Tax=Breznakia pachnodae TaxID=265178 RepID=A0ABU0E758_9FIRM|nr:SpaA isopeptide-forming pilin-related protein [Breznakia pachnodae]MDQ0362543.1 hypothetical protein [Breznakia pachnodae]